VLLTSLGVRTVILHTAQLRIVVVDILKTQQYIFGCGLQV
jgi:hypothetical protein